MLTKFKVLKYFVVLFVCLYSVETYANGIPYLTLDLGYSFPQKLKDYSSYNNKRPKGSIVYGMGAGYSFNSNFSADVNLTRLHKHKFSHTIVSKGNFVDVSQNFSNTIMMVNGYLNLGNYFKLSPFVTGGVGVTYNETKDYINFTGNWRQKGESTLKFAWGIGGGVSYNISKNIDLRITYNYLDLNKTSTSQVYTNGLQDFAGTRITTKFTTNIVKLGVVYKF